MITWRQALVQTVQTGTTPNNISVQMEKIMRNETNTHPPILRNNADKWRQQPSSAVSIRAHRLSCRSTCLSCTITFQPSLRWVEKGWIIPDCLATSRWNNKWALNYFPHWHNQALHQGVGNNTKSQWISLLPYYEGEKVNPHICLVASSQQWVHIIGWV